MEPKKPVLRSWYSTPAVNLTWSEVRTAEHESSAECTSASTPCVSLPAMATFLSPRSSGVDVPNCTSNHARGTHAQPVGRVANTLDPPARSVYMPPHGDRVESSISTQVMDSQNALPSCPAMAPTNSPSKRPVSMPKSKKAQGIPEEVHLAKTSSSHWAKQPHFRPVGVLMKNTKPAGVATFRAPPSSVASQGGPRPAYLCRVPSSPVSPQWMASSGHDANAVNWTCPDYQSSISFKTYPYYQPFQTTVDNTHREWRPSKQAMSCPEVYPTNEVIYAMRATKITSSPSKSASHGRRDPVYPGECKAPSSLQSTATMSPHSLTDTKSDVKVDLNMSAVGECVSKTVSVVTLLAHDTSYTTNNVSTTSQTESEFTLHDAKMQLTDATPMPEPPPPQCSSSLLCSLLQSSPSNVDNKPFLAQLTPEELENSQPGLEMLSDVSLLLESMTSQIAGEKSNISEQTISVKDSEIGLCPPQVTYVGTMPDSTSLNSSPRKEAAHGDCSDCTVLSPVSLPQDGQYTLSNPSNRGEAWKDVNAAMLPPKKSNRFTTRAANSSAILQCEGLSQDNAQLLLKLSTTITQASVNTPARRSGPRIRASISDSNVYGKTTMKQERTSKIQQPGQIPSETASRSLQDVRQKRNQQDKENVCDVSTQFQDIMFFDTEGKNSSREILPTAHFVTDPTESYGGVDKLHMDFSPHSSHEAQSNCFTATDMSASQQHAALAGATEYCDWGMGDCQNDATFLPTDVIEVPPDTNGTHETVTETEDYDLISKEFDPLVIAEEEVTSTQTHEEIVHHDGVRQENEGQFKVSKLRQRSHICVSCFTYPSSSDESKPPSPDYISCSRSSKWNIGKGKKTPVETKGKKRNTELADKTTMACEVCGRTFSSSNNLSRHKRHFHPSLFLSDTNIVELPLLSYRSMLPLSPSSMQSVKSPRKSLKRGPYPTASPKPLTRAQTKTPDSRGDGRSPCKRIKRKTSNSDDEMWRPELEQTKKRKKIKKANACQSQTKGVSGRGDTGSESDTVAQRTRKQKYRRTTDKFDDTRPQTRASLKKVKINFRTKKRTRINSTIPCRYCDRLFSVMSNLKRHTKQEHQDIYVFFCSVCGEKYSMRRTLKKHIKDLHAEYFPFCCPECLVCFKTETEMATHSQTHVVNRFPCVDCKIMFYIEDHLSEHLAKYHNTMK